MYSMGIIVFELWHPFSTGMERAELLRDLRYASKLPPEWEAQHSQVRASILNNHLCCLLVTLSRSPWRFGRSCHHSLLHVLAPYHHMALAYNLCPSCQSLHAYARLVIQQHSQQLFETTVHGCSIHSSISGWCVTVQVSALIRWVMSANPADRPTARELLRSDLLPPTVGDEQLQDVLRSLQDKSVLTNQVLCLCLRTCHKLQSSSLLYSVCQHFQGYWPT